MAVDTEAILTSKANGMNARFGVPVHFVAAEPHETFLRVVVNDRGREVAGETAVLGRIRGGHRVLQLRSLLGTRIQLCYLFVHVSFATEANLWPTPRQVRQADARSISRGSCGIMSWFCVLAVASQRFCRARGIAKASPNY